MFSHFFSHTHSSVYIQTLLKRIALFFFRRHFLNLSCIARSIIDACIFRIYLFINFIWMCMRGMTANAFTHRIWYAQNLCVSNEYKRIFMEFIFIWHWTVFMFERGKKTPNRFELTGDVYYYIFFCIHVTDCQIHMQTVFQIRWSQLWTLYHWTRYSIGF